MCRAIRGWRGGDATAVSFFVCVMSNRTADALISQHRFADLTLERPFYPANERPRLD